MVNYIFQEDLIWNYPEPSNQFLLYDPLNDKVKLLSPLKEPRQNHSMINYNDNIYIIGGEFSKMTEIFDSKNLTLIAKKNLNYVSVDNPILYIHKNYLYSFFGIKLGKFVDFVQRVNLDTEEMKWEKVPFKIVDKNLDLKLTNSGVIPISEKEILFCGGKSEKGFSNRIISFDFESKEFKDTSFEIEPHYFNNSQFYKNRNNAYCGFSSDSNETLLKIIIENEN